LRNSEYSRALERIDTPTASTPGREGAFKQVA